MPHKLYKRGNIWHVRGTAAGRRFRFSAKTDDRKLAERIAAERETQLWKCRLDGPGAGLTFAQAATAYLDAGKPQRFVMKIAAYWRDTPVREISAGAIRASARRLYPNVAPATLNRQVIAPTQAIINHCAEHEWCSPIKVRRFEVTTKVKRPVTLAWVKAFAAHASPHLGALALFMFGTGARIGEATALTWADVDLSRRTALIRQTKVNSERLAHLPPDVLAALANIPSRRAPASAVFRYGDRENVRKAWDAAIDRAGIERLSPHCCRHGFATAMLRRYDVKTVAKAGGWKDASTLLRTYAHAIEDITITEAIFDTDTAQSTESNPINLRRKRGNRD